KRIASLTPAKRELLARRLRERERVTDALKPTTIPRRNKSSSCPPLSFAQERLWFLNQLEPDSTAYNIFTCVRLAGSLNIALLKQSFREIVRRHESLRTTFAEIEGQPVQVISENADVQLPLVDLCEMSVERLDGIIVGLALAEAQRPFDFRCGPLFRVVLLRLGVEQHVVLLTMQHIISDAWSLELLMREVVAVYGAFAGGYPSSLAELPIQYADYAIWQRRTLQGEILEKQMAYWKHQLGSCPAARPLPGDRPRTSVFTDRGARQLLSLSEELSGALRLLSQREEATLFMLMLTAFQILLYTRTRQENILVGTPVASRNRVETENLIGFFINTLVLRTNFSGNPNFRQMLRRVREVSLGAFAHRDLPFEKLVQALEPSRTLHPTPLFHAGFTFRQAVREAFQLPGLSLSYMQIHSGRAQFDLNLNVLEEECGLALSLEYKTDLFDRSTINRMLSDCETLLQTIAARPEISLRELDEMLTQAERQRWIDRRGEITEAHARTFRQARRRSIAEG
ncbi:MAG TPA: condensation domain-containing protein, partial [Pyrinomonadaceae bacterium]|nr:condensation domain-containing protein [Pyrinomonadaceae bacterium]